jgi:hypothetical protein
MIHNRVLVLMVALFLTACGGGGDEEDAAAEGYGAESGTVSPPQGTPAPPAPAGTVDSAGVGTNPPTAGGSLVDTAAVPGPTDTVQGTPTAP